MKEKYDLSLDNRQIGSLLIGGIVVLGAVFVLGVVVGKKLSGSERAQGAPDLLSALDQKAAATDPVTDASLTFPEELTKKMDPIRDEPSAKKLPPEPKKEPAKPDSQKADDKAEKALAAAAPAAAPDAAAKPEATDPRPQLAEVAPIAGKVDAAPTPTRTATKDGGLKEAIARAARPETSPNGAFTLQLSASQTRAEADKFAARLRDKGYAPFIVTAEVPGRGTWYRVRMGSFASKDAASRYLQDFKRETQLEAFVAANDVKGEKQ